MATTHAPRADIGSPNQPNNPRRPPAHRSVSLLHGQKRRKTSLNDSDSSGDSAAAGSGSNSKQSYSPSSLQPLGKASSGESSNADGWFDKSNQEVRDNNASFADNDPPFFMRNNSSASQTPPDAQRQSGQTHNTAMASGSLPQRIGLVRLGTEGSSTEDYRGVIDDLTIENKKLKKRLKKYEKLHDAHLRDEKLFEVRFHGLPPDKKSELEATLQKFAASLGTNRFANGYEEIMPGLMTDKNASPYPSLPPTDSAYASYSASGQGSSSRSATESRSKQHGSQTSALRRENIHSYLHHIPEGLLPQTNPSNMTERTKQKLVVRRLEQIFAGKGAALGGHQHPQQQQEVSQMAARAEIFHSGQTTRLEGDREAHIMTEENENQVNLADSRAVAEAALNSNASPQKSPEQVSTQPSDVNNEQRPTRPLDLDPHRAQVPADNLRYIRHLGFSPSAHVSNGLEDGRGWVYLNLLINMAQLHTLNVTAEFVRKAVASRSSKFEVSSDGRKVRWRGGMSVTRESSRGGGSSTSRIGDDTPEGQSPHKRPRLTQRSSYRSQASHTENKLVYTPMFWNKGSTDGADYTSEEDESMSTPGHAPIAGDSSGFTSSGMRTGAPRKRPRDDGPIIFYHNARFCTDLSGDQGAQYNRNPPLYSPATELAIGELKTHSNVELAERRGPLDQASELPLPMDLRDNPIPDSMEIAFPSPSKAATKGTNMQPIDLEVSGIGGVWPADNFAINVESRHTRIPEERDSHGLPRRCLPSKFASLLKGSSPSRPSLPIISKQIVNASREDLPPSELPPALCFVSQSEEYESDDEDDGMSVSPVSDGGSVPAAAPQPVYLNCHGSTISEQDEEYDDDMDDDESDGSVDLLATARELDPEAIRLREREYDANMAERLAEEIPAGSSAATAGGGSGFASPAHGTSREDYQRALAEHRESRRGVLKRSMTGGSMDVQGAPVSSVHGEIGDEDEDEDMDDAGSVSS